MLNANHTKNIPYFFKAANQLVLFSDSYHEDANIFFLVVVLTKVNKTSFTTSLKLFFFIHNFCGADKAKFYLNDKWLLIFQHHSCFIL